MISTSKPKGKNSEQPACLFPGHLVLPLLVLVLLPGVAHAAGGGGNPWVTLLLKIINFSIYAGIIYFLYNKYGARAVKARSAKVTEHLQRSQAALSEAQAEYDQLKDKLNNIEGVRNDLFDRYNEEGRKQSTLLIESGNQAASRTRSDADKQIETELSQESKKIRSEVVAPAIEKARGKLEKISEEDDKRLRAEALKKFLKEGPEQRVSA